MHSTSNLNDNYMGSGKRITESIKLYGIENHKKEILEFLNDLKSLKKREKDIVNRNLLNDIKCLNINIGGSGSWHASNQNSNLQRLKGAKGNFKMKFLFENDIEWKIKRSNKISNSLKECYENGTRPKKHVDWTGRKHKQETKDKISKANSISQKGERNSQFGTMWVTNGINSLKINRKDNIPEGYRKGRILNKKIYS